MICQLSDLGPIPQLRPPPLVRRARTLCHAATAAARRHRG